MLYEYLFSLHDEYSVFNVFRYITFRTALAVMTALFFCLVLGPITIKRMRLLSVNQQIRQDGPPTHHKKYGTPTMGGLFILASIILTILLWGNLHNKYIWIMLLATTGYGLIGFLDDYLKLTKKNPKGLRGWYKLTGQIAIALAVTLSLYYDIEDPFNSMLSVPFIKDWIIDLGAFYIPFAILVIVGSSNAVNLTDGLDGLAIGLVAIAILANAIILYISGHYELAKYLQIIYLPSRGEMAVFCGAIFGASLGFLWFNCHPAQVFMGDVGSLSLGGALGTIAVITKHEIVLALVGAIFVMEALSVMLQVVSFKTTGKRVFKMAPIHHHFEMKGWHESKVIVRFWIIGIVLALLSLATLKLR